ncbi:glycosyltransferase family 2 protein [Microbacterium sp. A93]|uniref:glycosyltransferase family 2 protein n=1 Tax=Microbacterium sp. A93 TaxID=3450716 RepID=UPI003F43FB42
MSLEIVLNHRRRIPLMRPHADHATSAAGVAASQGRGRQSTGSETGATATVVILCYNYGRFLPGAVASATEQAGVDVDVVIVDDCSTDDSAEVASRLAAADPRVQLIRHEVNRGPVEAFNRGLKAATGEFLVRLDADDLLTTGSLARAVQLAQEFPSVGLVYGHPIHFTDGQALPPAREQATAWTLWPGADWVQARCMDARNVITSAEVVMRSSVVDRVGGQRDLTHTHDMEMWLRLASFSDVGYVHGADQAWHRDHPASLSARKVDVVVDLEERRLAFDTLFSGPVGDLEWTRSARDRVRRALDREVLDLLEHEVDVDGGRSPLFGRLRELDLEPTRVNLVRRDKILRRAQDARGPVDKSASLARRIRGRFKNNAAWRNWHRNGEF